MGRKSKDGYSEICERVPADKKYLAEKLATEIRFMDQTIIKLKTQIKESGSVEEFKQGKQHFMRENPALKSYANLIKTRSAAYSQLLGFLPKQNKEASDDGDDFDDFVSGRDYD